MENIVLIKNSLKEITFKNNLIGVVIIRLLPGPTLINAIGSNLFMEAPKTVFFNRHWYKKPFNAAKGISNTSLNPQKGQQEK